MDQCKQLFNSLANVTVKSPVQEQQPQWQPKQKRGRKKTKQSRNDPMYAETANPSYGSTNMEDKKQANWPKVYGQTEEQNQNTKIVVNAVKRKFDSQMNMEGGEGEEAQAQRVSGASIGQYHVKIHSPKLRESKGERSPSELKLQCYKNSTDEAFEEFNNEIYKRVHGKRGKSADVRSSCEQLTSEEEYLSASSDELLEIPEESPSEQKTPVKGNIQVNTKAGLSTASSDRNQFEEKANIQINGCQLQIEKLNCTQQSVFNRDYFDQFGDVQQLTAETNEITKLTLLSILYSSESSALNARIDLQHLLLNSKKNRDPTQIERKLQGYQRVRMSKGIPLSRVDERLERHMTQSEEEEAQAQSNFTFNLLKLKGTLVTEEEDYSHLQYRQEKQKSFHDSTKKEYGEDRLKNRNLNKHVPTKLLFGCFSEQSNPLLLEDQAAFPGRQGGGVDIDEAQFLYTDESGRFDTQFTVDQRQEYATEEAILNTQLRLSPEDLVPNQSQLPQDYMHGNFFPTTPAQQAMASQAHARLAQATPFVFQPSESSNKSEGKRSNGSGNSHSHVHRHTWTSQFKIELDRVNDRKDSRTTVMIKNIPNKYTEEMLTERIQEGLQDKHPYDFFYLPIDAKNLCNVGYAFINFVDQQSILALHNDLDGKTWSRFNSEKVCEITYARVQGRANLVNNFYSKQSSNEKRTKVNAQATAVYYNQGKHY